MTINAVEMDRDRGGQHVQTALRERDSNDATIALVRSALDQPVAFQSVDKMGGPTAREHDSPRQLRGGEILPRTASQAYQHLEPSQRKPAGFPELPIEDRHQLGVGLEEQAEGQNAFVVEGCGTGKIRRQWGPRSLFASNSCMIRYRERWFLCTRHPHGY